MKKVRIMVCICCTVVLMVGIIRNVQNGNIQRLIQYYLVGEKEEEVEKEEIADGKIHISYDMEFQKGETKKFVYPKIYVDAFWKMDSETIADVIKDFKQWNDGHEYFETITLTSDDSIAFTKTKKQLDKSIKSTEENLNREIQKAKKEGMIITISEDFTKVEYYLQEGCRMKLVTWMRYCTMISAGVVEAQIFSGKEASDWSITQTIQREEADHPMSSITISEKSFSGEITDKEWNEGLEIPTNG